MIRFIDFDPAKELADAVSRYEEVSGETLFPGDEHYLFLAQQVQVACAAAEQINTVANQNLLRNMNGELLDEFGEQYDVRRLEADYATVQLRFQMAAPLPFALEIPSGVRVTPDGQINFIVAENVIIPAGSTETLAEAIAEKPGSGYNGFLPGQIRNIVDINLVGNVDSVTNTTTSAGGADVETDDSYRERIQLSWEGISTCGSKEGYEYWARSASADIVDVEAASNDDSEITLYVLLRDAAAPSQALLDAVLAATTAEKRRPLTDKVFAAGAQEHAYDISLTYYISADDSTEETKIRAAVDEAVERFAAGQKKRLGGNLNPDSLRREILRAGGYRIDITSPVYTELEPQEVAVAGTVTVEYGGLL